MNKKKTKISILVLVLICLLVMFGTLNFSTTTVANAYFNVSARKVPIYAVKTDEKKVAISFDAAWGADKTRQIMDICDSYNVKATFFLVGFWVEEYPEITKEINDRGFEIGLHSSTHPDMTKLSKDNQKLELSQNIDILKSVIGYSPTLFRPPFGAYNNALIESCKELGLKTIQWSVDSLDWKGISAENIASRVCERTENGSIVLFHNNSDNIINGLKMVLSFYEEKGFQAVPVGELIYQNSYTINQQGIQIKK